MHPVAQIRLALCIGIASLVWASSAHAERPIIAPTWWLWSKVPGDIAWTPLVPALNYTDCVERLLYRGPLYHWSIKGPVLFKCEVEAI